MEWFLAKLAVCLLVLTVPVASVDPPKRDLVGVVVAPTAADLANG